jgi:uncharacterized membrane protein YkoI
LIAVSLAVGIALAASAQQPGVAGQVKSAAQQPGAARSYQREVPDSLAAQTRITEDSARAIAQRRIPRGVVQKLEVERERGHLIYSWELKIPGHPGIEEVNVDALTGRIIGVEHEADQPARADTTLKRHRPAQPRPAGTPRP